jgi:hypothetical protein
MSIVTSTGAGFTAFVDDKVIGIHCLQPAPDQSLRLTSKAAEKERSWEENI